MTASCTINGVHLDEIDSLGVRWPLYRGSTFKPVAIVQGIQRFDELVAAMKPNGNSITFTAPDNPGANAGEKSVTISDVWCERVEKIDDFHCAMVLADNRYELARLTFVLDFNVKLDEKYLEGTSQNATTPITLADAVKKIVGVTGFPFSITVERAHIGSRELPDNLLLSGMPWHSAMDALLESVDCDLTVDTQGKLFVVDREHAAHSVVSLDAVPWLVRPAFVSGGKVFKTAPSGVAGLYMRKVQFASTIEYDDTRTSAGNDPVNLNELAFEQVYAHDGKFVTGLELVEAVLTASTNYSLERLFAANWASEGWNETGLSLALKTNNIDNWKIAQEVVPIIKRDWRQLFRFKINPEHVGHWTNIEFGTLAEDGQMDVNDSVDCRWFELHNTIVGDWKDFFKDAKYGRNFPSDLFPNIKCPLVATWVDKKEFVFRIGRSTGTESVWVMPGNVIDEPGFRRASFAAALQDQFKDRPVIEMIPVQSLKFTPHEEITVKFSAILRGPKDGYDSEKYYTASATSQPRNPGARLFTLPVVENITANFDDITASEPMNEDAIQDDVNRRAYAVLRSFERDSEGNGIAHGLVLLDAMSSRVSGAITSLEIQYGTQGRSFCGVAIEAREMSNSKTDYRNQAKRDSHQQQRSERGKEVR